MHLYKKYITHTRFSPKQMLRSTLRAAAVVRSASARAGLALSSVSVSGLSVRSTAYAHDAYPASTPFAGLSTVALRAPLPAFSAHSTISSLVSAPVRAAAPARAFSADACSTEKASTAAVMQKVLTETLSPVHLAIEDTSGGCGAFFRIVVVSPAFEGKRTMARHRVVQGAIAESIKGMHGLTLMTHTPAEWEALTAAQ